MGFWNKLGKIALQAAPYVAAPFTGGASLMATGVTQKLGQKWAEHDAKEAIAKGVAPSKFDKYLGMASAGAGLASAFTGGFGGALNGAGKSVGTGVGAGAKLGSIASKAGTGASTASKLGNVGKIASAAVGKGNVGGWQGAVGKLAGDAVTSKLGGSGQPLEESSGWEGQLGSLIANAASSRGGEDQITSQSLPSAGPSAPSSTAVPRSNSGGMAAALARGKNEALINQPFRSGYQVVAQGPEEGQTITSQMPRIYPNYGPPASDDGSAPRSIFNQAPPEATGTPIANRFGDELTPRRAARRRVPVEEVEY